jgi:hypothetical protein
VPLCESPQDIAPLQAAGGSAIYDRSDVVWNGKDYAVAWVDGADNHLHFRRFFADGTPAAAGLIPSTLTSLAYPPSLVWNGSGYGVAWMAWSGSYYQIYFARLDANGALIGGSEVKASFVGSNGTFHCYGPSLAWSGAGYCVAWHDNRNGSMDIFATLLNSDGTIANSGASHDLVLCKASNDQDYPSVAWSKGAGLYKVVWEDYRSVSHYEIWGASLTPSGAVIQDGSALVSGTADSYHPALCDMGNGLGLAWCDSRDNNTEIYFARLTASGAKLGDDVRLTSDGANSFNPRVVWTGAEYGVFWQDNRSGNYDLWFQRVSAAGAVIGSNTQVTATSEMRYPGAAFARYGYLATGTISGGANFVQAWGCGADSTPPSCPTNLLAYNVTGTSATISWGPSGDAETDIAYYQVYRNNIPVAKTSDTLYADSGLALNTTYNYMVQPVNAAQLQNYTCGSSLYLKTNATLTLTVNKSQPDAVLSWTDASMNNYNVFRGTSPQVMQQIGSTSGQSFSDKNALMDNNLYFYTVDEPGQ